MTKSIKVDLINIYQSGENNFPLFLPAGISSCLENRPDSNPCCKGEYASKLTAFSWHIGKTSYSGDLHSKLYPICKSEGKI